MDDLFSDRPTDRLLLPLRANACGQGLVLVSLALLGLGVVMVHSAMASVRQPGAWYARVDIRHTIFAAMAALVLLVGWRFDYRRLAAGRAVWPAVGLLIGAMIFSALVFAPGVGHAIGSKYRWLRIGPKEYSIGFQPSELLKVAMVVFLAAWLTRRKTNVRSWKTFALCGVVVGGCVGLVVTEDFGTAVLLGLAAGLVMFLAGVPWYFLLPSLLAAGAAGYHFIVNTPYRLGRLQAMLDPWNEANPAAYHPRQSLIAILSGGWTGRGLGNGVRKLGFLPEDSTDFIFAAFCEEWGFRGAVLLLGLLGFWMLHCRRSAARAADPFGRVLAASLGAMIALQAMLHIAVNIVVLPPTGIALPLVSAGGTSLVVMAAAVSLILSVSARPAVEPTTADFDPGRTPQAILRRKREALRKAWRKLVRPLRQGPIRQRV
jgi:cell division protein FtsW